MYKDPAFNVEEAAAVAMFSETIPKMFAVIPLSAFGPSVFVATKVPSTYIVVTPDKFSTRNSNANPRVGVYDDVMLVAEPDARTQFNVIAPAPVHLTSIDCGVFADDKSPLG
jgi:hypothetical protein